MSFRSAVFKYRGLLLGVFFVLALFTLPASFSLPRMFLAVLLLFAGQALRFWAAGVISEYRTLVIGAPVLVKHGPYAWIRNPLYAGNALIGCGWALMAGWTWVLCFMVIFFAMYSLLIIPDEEKFLAERFGEEYESFRRETPSMFPGLRRISEHMRASRGAFDAAKSWSMEWKSLWANALMTLLVLERLFLIKG